MQAGTTINKRYLLLNTLGQGGMSIVYQAEDTQTHQLVAVKTCLSNEEKSTLRLQNEIQILQKVIHPNIIRMLDFGTDKDVPFIVLEYLDGHKINQFVPKNIGLPWSDVFPIIYYIMQGVHALHNANIVHCDLKPGNIFMCKTNHSRRICLIDFGIAQDLSSHPSSQYPQTAVGSAGYVAPEQINQQPITPATDIYSLGLITAFLLTGRHAFTGRTDKEILHKQLRGDTDILQAPQITAISGLPDVIEQAIQLKPKNRPSFVAQLLAELQALPYQHALQTPEN